MVDATPAIRFEEPITVKAAAQFLGVSLSLVYVDARRLKFAKYVAKRRAAFRRRPELIGHDRTPENLASRELGFRAFLLFAKEAGAIANDEGTDLEITWTLALMRSVVAQIGAVDQSDEFEEYLGLLGTAIATDQGGVANASDATAPDDYLHLGWKRFGDGPSPQGTCLGWLDGEHVYLDPELCYQTANSVAWRLGGDLALQACTLKKRLKQKGLLASFDERRTTTRKTINGTQKCVLHLKTTILFPGSGQTGQEDSDSISN